MAELPIHPAFVGDNVAQDVVENVVENVVDRLDLIILLLKEDNTLSATQLAKQLGVTSRTIQRDLEKLSKAGRIKHVGPDKGGNWEILCSRNIMFWEHNSYGVTFGLACASFAQTTMVIKGILITV